jgi:DNA-binding GntR family transcriptional regulator
LGVARNLGEARTKLTTVVDHIVDTIKDGVRLGRYVPGQRLIESDFLSETGFSRGPLREALRHLEADGVVLLEKNRGAVVRRYSRDEIRNLYEVRELLETHAARLAARRVVDDDRAAASIEGSRRRMRRTLVKDAIAEYTRENTRFHVLVAEASGNPWLKRIIETLQLPVDRLAVLQLVTLGASKSSLSEHEEIIDAILAGDAARAEKAMRVHLRNSRKMVESLPERAFR